MALRVRIWPAFFTAGLIAVSVSGCNIFDFAVDNELTPVQQAEEAIRDGDYDAAINALSDSTGALKDSTDSMLLYTYAKAVLLKSGLSVAELGTLIMSDEGAQGGANQFLAKIDAKGFGVQTAWYQGNVEVGKILELIKNGSATGDIDSSDIALDYSIANIMGGMLSLRDTNRDKVINSNDFQIKLEDVTKMIGGQSTSGFDFAGITVKDANGITLKDSTGDNDLVFSGLTAFLGGFSKVAPKRAKIAAGYNYTPNDINPLISTLFTFLTTSEDVIVQMVADYSKDTASVNSSIDPEKVREYIHKAARIVNCYWYDDGIDNDHDNRVDEEIINGRSDDDDNGDGVIDGRDLVDEDSGLMPGYGFTTPYSHNQYVSVFTAWDNKTRP